jgi:hypothetical protein
MDEIALRSGKDGSKEDHYRSVLERMVAAASQDHSQVRTLIYEFARRKLRKDLFRQFEDGDWEEIEHHVSTLENAINGIEADFSYEVPSLPKSTARSDPQGEEKRPSGVEKGPVRLGEALDPISNRGIVVGDYVGNTIRPTRLPALGADRSQPIVTIINDHEALPASHSAKYLQSPFWQAAQLVIAVVLGVGIFSAIDGSTAFGWLRRLHGPTNVEQTSLAGSAMNTTPIRKPPSLVSLAALGTGMPDIPIPNSYGVYAVGGGQATSLDTLPIKVPDPRVAISAAISTPSQAHLPAGPIQFLVYRRDVANNVPDRVSVRVIAQVARALTFDQKGAAFSNVDRSWVVRSNSYMMSVTPVAENPEMVVIQPELKSTALPSGRYALVLKSGAYDFTIDGPAHDPAHCLERTDAVGVPIYTECRKP